MLASRELDFAAAKKRIVSFIERRTSSAGADGAVLGLSGGVDSAVTAYLTVEALGSRRVMALIMPDLRVTPQVDVSDAKEVAEELDVEARMIDITPIHRAFMKGLVQNRLAEGNLRARIRMALLYYYANSQNRIVVGTGDRSEALVGYFTKYGDGGVDILPIGDLYKTEVRKLGEVLGVDRRIITKRSSPRLWPGQTAEGELGAGYEVIDDILRLHVDQKKGAGETAARLGIKTDEVMLVLGRLERSAHKRRKPEVCKVH
ncbi:MAG: NAD+ synthase [Nitrososphaerota archaeon]|nr:NAD+ synthase [Nitrososphaerota archaeon]